MSGQYDTQMPKIVDQIDDVNALRKRIKELEAERVVGDAEARERAAKVLFDLFGDDYEWTELGEQDKQQYRNAVDAVLDAKGEPFAVPLKPSLLKKHDAALKGETQGGN
jgi:hypothetical protein